MNDFSIRPLEPSDANALRELVATRGTAACPQRTERMLWIAFRNPHADGRPTYLVAEREGELIGYLGRMPTAFVVHGRQVPGSYWHDLYVSPEAREQGLGFFVAMALYGAMEDETEGFCPMIWATDTNRQLLDRRGYHRIDARAFVRILDPADYIERHVPVGAVARLLAAASGTVLRLLDVRALVRGIPRIEVRPVQRFDERFDALASRLKDRLAIGTWRDSRYLNWKWVDGPAPEVTVLEVRRDGELSGFMILGLDDDGDGRILDLLCDPDDGGMVSALFREAIRRFRRMGARSVQCVLSDPRFADLAARWWFVPRARIPMWIRNLADSGAEATAGDVRGWHLTYGESDFISLGA